MNNLKNFARPRPLLPLIRADVFPLSLAPHIIGTETLVQLPLPEPKQIKIYKDFHYSKLEHSA